MYFLTGASAVPCWTLLMFYLSVCLKVATSLVVVLDARRVQTCRRSYARTCRNDA